MRSFFLFGLCATVAAQGNKNYQDTCPASIWAKSVNGRLLDKSKYFGGNLPGPDSVLYIGDLTTKGDKTVIMVNAAANKNNKALDVVVGDAWLVVEDGADFEVIADDEVKVCRTKDCSPVMTKAKPAFNYKLGKPVTCGGAVCPKTCSGKHNCDYWAKEEDYSCKSLEEEYGCDCSGCKCDIDHKSCDNKLAKKKCSGKSCDEWILFSSDLNCQLLEKDFKCSCTGCECKPPPKCDAKAKKFCSDAYKEPCSGKSPTCGACIKGYASDNKYGCGAWKNCNALGKIEDKAGTPKNQPVCGRDFVCRCEGGTGATGLKCSSDGADKCVSCDSDKQLIGLKCVAKTTAPPKTTGQSCNGVCGSQQYKGDGNCDDENNNCGCGYDGGDCCKQTVAGGTVNKNYCKSCSCLDPKHQGKCDGTCGNGQYKGDGNCDDENNNCGCSYDGGDCCGTNVKKNYCQECKCKDPGYKAGACNAKCADLQYKGDGNCDDANNNCGCAYDGGDCCGVDVKKAYCKECKCKDPNYKPDSNCPGSCGNAQYKGDGNCDDGNNNCGCAYDGGDCCAKSVGGPVKKAYCKECKCKDPKNQGGADPNCKGSCGNGAYKGDGNCDDENNNCGCAYDGGDCCAKSVGGPVKKAYCKECKCTDPKNQGGADPNCTGQCADANYKGDGNCDDANNVCGCGYDGGDCCKQTVAGGTIKKNYCKMCKCVDPKYKPKADPNCKGTCGNGQYKADGNCDDENNNCGCDYDGGDCCGANVKKSYCKECKCQDPNYKPPSGDCKGKCGAPKYEGDGVCDDNNNNCGCRFDGGDCCAKTAKGGQVNKAYCKQCKCVDPKAK